MVPVAFVHERPSIRALVAFKFDVVTPPKKVTATEVVAPRAVTEARVSASAPAEGQLVPFERQTLKPPTKTCVEDTRLEKRLVVVTLVMVALVLRMAEILPEFAINEPMTPLVV